MTPRARALLVAVLSAAMVWHLLALWGEERQASPRDSAGRDFASYYYAARVAAAGGDPYAPGALAEEAAVDGLRRQVHPFFYPPPYLLVVAWAPATGLLEGFAIWRALDELATLLTGVLLAVWWRSLARREGSAASEVLVPAVVAVCLAGFYPVLYGHQMGQANFLVLGLTLGGLWLTERNPLLGGAAVGMACMWKMSPALFVAWWLLHRQWRPALAAIGTAVVASVATLPVLGAAEQLRFYTDVLPGFGSGNYNGLTIRIDMFGNHSIPNLFEQLWPGDQTRLTPPAQRASTATALALVGALGIAFRRLPVDPLQRAGQIAALATTTLLLPVYTYEHHLVWAIPGVVVAIAGAARGRLPAAFWPLLGFAVAAFAYPLPDLKSLATDVLYGPSAWIAQEAKFFATTFVWSACVWIGAVSPAATRTSAD